MHDDEDRFYYPPKRVSLGTLLSPAVSPTPRRLSSRFSEPSRALPSARKQLAWVSLQGRLVGAPEATSAKAIGGGLSRKEAATWEFFTPLHRVLIVAISAVATTESKRAQKIAQLQRSVDLRDQVLLSMQKKLDNLCDQMNDIKNKSVDYNIKVSPENEQFVSSEILEPGQANFCSCGCKIMELNPESGIVSLCGNFSNKSKDVFGSESDKDEMLRNTNANMVEQEERRMSDLSFCSSITSSVDIQLSTLAVEQDLYNLRKECEEKDVTIKDLAAAAHASSIADSKRIIELEDIIKRKNTMIAKLKKDRVVLEQKVVQLTRLRRPSSATSNSDSAWPPVMATNLLYDMSSSGSSSSDSDSPIENRKTSVHGSVTKDSPQQSDLKVMNVLKKPSVKSLNSSSKSTDSFKKQQSVCPLKEKQINQKAELLKPRNLASCSGDLKRIRRHTEPESRTVPQKK